jgi:hypothetical protein
VALGQVFSENFGFPCQSTFHLLLHNHGRSANRKKKTNKQTSTAYIPVSTQQITKEILNLRTTFKFTLVRFAAVPSELYNVLHKR